VEREPGLVPFTDAPRHRRSDGADPSSRRPFHPTVDANACVILRGMVSPSWTTADGYQVSSQSACGAPTRPRMG
jgi:hypothetical protein